MNNYQKIYQPKKKLYKPAAPAIIDLTPKIPFIPKPFKPIFDRSWFHNQIAFVHGGRASGKTTQMCIYLLYEARSERTRIHVAREFMESIDASLKSTLEEEADKLNIWREFEWQNKDIFHREHGSHIDFSGLARNVHSIQGKHGIDICLVDEAQAISQVSDMKLVPTMNRGGTRFHRLRKKEHLKTGKIIYVFNPNSVDDPVYRKSLGDERNPLHLVIGVNWNQNPFLDKPTIDYILHMKETNPGMYHHVYGGEALLAGDDIIYQHGRNWWIEDNRDFVRSNTDQFVPYVGLDFGYENHMIAITCYVKYDDNRNITMFYIDEEVADTHVQNEDLAAFVGGTDARGRYANRKNYPGLWAVRERRADICVDNNRPEHADHLAKYFNIHRAIKGKGSPLEGIEYHQSIPFCVHPSCEIMRDNLSNYRWQRDPKTEKPIYDKPIKKNDHGPDALRYMSELVRKPQRKSIGIHRGSKIGAH